VKYLRFHETLGLDSLTPEKIARDIQNRIEDEVKTAAENQLRKSVQITGAGTDIFIDESTSIYEETARFGSDEAKVSYADNIYTYQARSPVDRSENTEQAIQDAFDRAIENTSI
jgi:hypothetical protein